jgi:beta-lactam-binding protein with PASTA domain
VTSKGAAVKLVTVIDTRGSRKLIFVLITVMASIGCATTTNTAPFAQLESVVRGNRLATGAELNGVQVTRADAPVATVTGMGLQKGDRIVTDGSTEAVIFFGDAYEVILAPDTDITILNPTIFQKIGKAVVKKLKQVREAFRVETEYVKAGPKGTEFAISVDRASVVSLVVLEGEVTIESRAQTWAPQTIGPRQAAVVRSGQQPSRRDRLPQADLDRTFGWARRVEAITLPAVIPNLSGLTVDEARRRLSQAGLQAGSVRQVAGQPVGTVLQQGLPPGQRVRLGTRVDLDVAGESTVPNVTGMTSLEAGIVLGMAGLNVGETSEEEGIGGRPGRVARQDPAPGTRVPPGTSVSLVLAAGRPPGEDYREEPRGDLCRVPDIRRVPVESASGILREHNLRLGSVRRVEGRQARVTQNPEPGAQVRCGSSVDLVIYSVSPGTYDAPPETFCTVPDIRRVPVENASAVLRERNLQLGSVRRVEGRRAGVTQNPLPDAQVRCGSSVDLVIYFVRSITPDAGPAVETHPTVCTVPDVRGLNAEGARRTLKAHGLVLGEFQAGGDERRQSPEPNTTVRCGTTVNVYAVIL